MEIKQIKELMAVMARTGTKRIVIKKEGFEVELERENSRNHKIVESTAEYYEDNPLKNEIALHRANMMLSRGSEIPSSLNAGVASKGKEEDVNSIFVKSPMVGTFFSSPAPDASAFVKVGDKIDKDSVVCIIEAMKVMNEIKSGVSGTVTEVLVESGHPVEFGAKLFRILP